MKINFLNKNNIDYFFLLLLIFLSGNQVFGELTQIIGFILSFLFFFYRKKQFDYKFVILVTILVTILLLQTLRFDYYPWITIIGVLVRVFFVYFILVSIGKSFINKFIQIMYYISIISLVVFSLIMIIPGFEHFLINNFTLLHLEGDGYSIQRYFLGFFTVAISPIYGTLYRNAGLFWEAGALGGYVMLAMIFNIMKTGQIFNKFGIVFIITIFTTISTTSIIALFILLVAYGTMVKKNDIFRWFLVPIVILSGFYAFNKLEFLNEKITNSIALLNTQSNLLYGPSSRFLDAARDLDDFKGHELLGRGGNNETRFLQKYRDNNRMGRTDGVTDHLVRYGTFFFLITMFYLYRSQVAVIIYFNHVDQAFAFVTTSIIFFILLQSELYFNYPLFWGLLFLYIYQKEDHVVHRHTSI